METTTGWTTWLAKDPRANCPDCQGSGETADQDGPWPCWTCQGTGDARGGPLVGPACADAAGPYGCAHASCEWLTDTCALDGAEFAPGPAGTCPWRHTRADSAAYEAYQAEEAERHLAECGAPFTTGPAHDPYGSACDLEARHGGPHEGPDPLGPDGWRISWEGGGSCAGDPVPHHDVVRVPVDGVEGNVLAYLRRALSYGLAAEVTINAAKASPGQYAYTPDGCAWVICRPATTTTNAVSPCTYWTAGRSTKAEAALAAAAHPQLAPARYATEGE